MGHLADALLEQTAAPRLQAVRTMLSKQASEPTMTDEPKVDKKQAVRDFLKAQLVECENNGCDTPGEKIRSEGKGRGMGTGGGKGPIGVPINKEAGVANYLKEALLEKTAGIDEQIAQQRKYNASMHKYRADLASFKKRQRMQQLAKDVGGDWMDGKTQIGSSMRERMKKLKVFITSQKEDKQGISSKGVANIRGTAPIKPTKPIRK